VRERKEKMEFGKLIRERYSVRAYLPKPVEEEKLKRVLEAAILAPTAANRQAFRLIVIPTSGRQDELRRIYAKDWFTQAPYVICACSLPGESWTRKDGKNYGDVDVAIVMDHLILAAADEGLGTCWVGAFDPEAAREVLGIPPEAEVVPFTPVGYPADKPGPKKRKGLGQLLKYEIW
jgi:nitroreductase